mmetsp:Transcript_15682/g.26246  ORF Transcript_15682/g.26246 Transcript_15682/m.26246 type:complete len:222 (+) Transcript_15682:427-1092(+)
MIKTMCQSHPLPPSILNRLVTLDVAEVVDVEKAEAMSIATVIVPWNQAEADEGGAAVTVRSTLVAGAISVVVEGGETIIGRTIVDRPTRAILAVYTVKEAADVEVATREEVVAEEDADHISPMEEEVEGEMVDEVVDRIITKVVKAEEEMADEAVDHIITMEEEVGIITMEVKVEEEILDEDAEGATRVAVVEEDRTPTLERWSLANHRSCGRQVGRSSIT